MKEELIPVKLYISLFTIKEWDRICKTAIDLGLKYKPIRYEELNGIIFCDLFIGTEDAEAFFDLAGIEL